MQRNHSQLKDWGSHLLAGFMVLFPLAVAPVSLVYAPWEDLKVAVLVVVAFLLAWKIRRQALFSVFGILTVIQWALFVASSLTNGLPLFNTMLGNIYRQDGIIYHTAFSVFMLGVYSYFQNHQPNERILYLGLLVSFVLQGALAVLFMLGFDFTSVILPDKHYHLPMGTMGNYSAFTVLMMVFYVVFIHRFLRHGDWMALAASVVSLVIISFNLNRAILFPLLVVQLFLMVQHRRYVLFAVLSVLLLFSGGPLKQRVYTQVYTGAADQAILNKNLSQESTLKSRLMYWKVAVDGMRHMPLQPLLGWGSEAFRLVQIRHTDPNTLMEMARLEYGLTGEVRNVHKQGSDLGEERSIFTGQFVQQDRVVPLVSTYTIDRAHNFFLDQGLKGGVVFSLIWLVLLAVPFFRQVDGGWQWESKTILFVVGCYLMFFFDMVQWFPVFLVFLSYIWANLKPHPPPAGAL